MTQSLPSSHSPTIGQNTQYRNMQVLQRQLMEGHLDCVWRMGEGWKREREFPGGDFSDELEDRVGVSPVPLNPGCT